MKQINIAFITDRMIKGHGVDLVVDRLADGLAKKSCTCSVYCNYLDETFTGRKSYKIVKLPYIKPVSNPIIYERRIRKLAPYLNSMDIDLFIIQSFPFYGLIPKLNGPVIAVDHGIISTVGLPLKRRLKFKYMEISQNISYLKKADKLITVSKYLLDCLPNNLRKKAAYIYNGCDHYRQKEVPEEKIKIFREKMGLAPKDTLLLYIGRLNLTNQPYKGLDELVKIYQNIYKNNKNVKLLAVGYGSKNDEELLRNEGVLAMSNAPEELMPLIYSSCDIYTTCSHWEGFDLPVTEAQSFKKPVVCYDIGAHPEVVLDKKTGYVVKDNKEFTEKLNLIINNPDLQKEMGESAAEFVKKFSWENTINNYNAEIKKLPGLKNSATEPKAIPEKNKNNQNQTVTAIIVNYNSSYSCLKECIDSLKAQTYKDIEILIFDNNSQNDTLSSIKKEYRDIKIMHSDKNLGLGEGLNQAIGKVKTKYILISSFDVTYNAIAVAEFVESINKLGGSYMGLAPKIKLSYQRDYIESVGLYLDSNFYIGYNGIGQLDLNQYNRPEDIFGVSFTSGFLKTEAFANSAVGLMDPAFFLFYEDIDFCYRANLLGCRFKSCPTAVCYHKYAYSFRDEATSFQKKYYYLKLNLLKTAYKNAEKPNLTRIIDNELKIQKQNLKDINLKPIAKHIIRDFKKSIRYLKRQRKSIQFSRQSYDSDIIKYCLGEYGYFDIVKNEPICSILNLHNSYRRLFVLVGSRKYEEYVNYLINLENTRFKIETKILRRLLHKKLEHEPQSVHDFIDRIN